MGEIADAVNKRLGSPAKPTPKPEKPAPIRMGSKVMITGNRYATGGVIPAWAKKIPHTVSRIDSTQVLLGADGGINSWVPWDGVVGV
jgi:hypothetical protein